LNSDGAVECTGVAEIGGITRDDEWKSVKGCTCCLGIDVTCLEIESEASNAKHASQNTSVDIPNLKSILNECGHVLAEYAAGEN